MSLSRFTTYQAYERELAGRHLIPKLAALGFRQGSRVLDIGCGEGGFLIELASGLECTGVGIERDGAMIRAARAAAPAGVSFVQADALEWKPEGTFDLVLLRDVLEHCEEPQRLLIRAVGWLGCDALLFLSFTPFLSPFGGHQHNGSSTFSRVPYLQLLPRSLFLGLLKVRGNLYKERDALSADIHSVLATRLRTRHVERWARALPLGILERKGWIVRPDFEVKHGIRRRELSWPASVVRFADPFLTGVEYWLRRRETATEG